MISSRQLLFGSVASAMAIASAASGQSQGFDFDLPAQPLKESLEAIARTSGLNLFATSDDISSREAPAIQGRFAAQDALDQILAGSGLKAEIKGRRIVVRPIGGDAELAPTTDILVTGSRIRGAAIASPMVTLSQTDIIQRGKTTLGDAIRTLPQNFRGGQNPGILGNGDQGNSADLNGSSNINLRGLGPDATLTLLNGHRLAYDGYTQGIDIDAIPLAALDRIEIVPDGASALYGSDAVGGVANILLKKDFEGLTVSGRYGGTADGGGQQQQYSGVTGHRWNGGGIITAVDYSRTKTITAGDRSYTAQLDPSQTLYPDMRHITVVANGHQRLGPADFEIDALYSHRRTHYNDPFYATSSAFDNGLILASKQTSFEVSPKLQLPVGASWQAYVTGTYAQDRTQNTNGYYFSSKLAQAQTLNYNGTLKSVEGGLDGPLVELFGQSIRSAIGLGYRTNRLSDISEEGGLVYFGGTSSQSSYYAFGELSIPLVSPNSHVSGINSLSVSAALRYEDYPAINRIATPKFGLIFKPIADLTIKGSWGKSFKAPTLFQRSRQDEGFVAPASYFGSSSLPPNGNVLEWVGGNASLKPERATSWTITGEWKPSRINGLELSLSYFHTRYSKRVSDPILPDDGLFTQSKYQSLIHYSPTPDYLDAIAKTIPLTIETLSGAPYDPSTIVAVIDGRSQNIAKQVISGVDADVRYSLTLADQRSLSFSGSASYLRSRQQFGPGESLAPLSGELFFMPRWNAFAGLTYTTGDFSITSDLTYIGGVRDDRFAPVVHIGAMTPVDITGIYHIHSRTAVLNKMDVTLTIQNIQNQKPGRVRTQHSNAIPYDSTNYSAIGRFVSFTITKSF